MLRWVAACVLEAVKGFRRLKGRAAMRRDVQFSRHTPTICSPGVSLRPAPAPEKRPPRNVL
jgi:hypothetical protein